MSSKWLAAFLEAGGDAHVVTIPTRAENAKIAKIPQPQPAKPSFGNSGNFGTALEKQNSKGLAAAHQWTSADWQEYFNERAGIAEHCGGMVRDKAERMAFESCITRWLDTHPPAHTDDAICPHCQKPNGAPGTSSIPTLAGSGGHLWLHHSCLEPWRAQRREAAIAALADIGIIRQGGISSC